MKPMSEGEAFRVAALLLLEQSNTERQQRAAVEAALEQTGTFYRSVQGTYYRVPEADHVFENRLGKRFDCSPANDQLSSARKGR